MLGVIHVPKNQTQCEHDGCDLFYCTKRGETVARGSSRPRLDAEALGETVARGSSRPRLDAEAVGETVARGSSRPGLEVGLERVHNSIDHLEAQRVSAFKILKKDTPSLPHPCAAGAARIAGLSSIVVRNLSLIHI